MKSTQFEENGRLPEPETLSPALPSYTNRSAPRRQQRHWCRVCLPAPPCARESDSSGPHVADGLRANIRRECCPSKCDSSRISEPVEVLAIVTKERFTSAEIA